MKLDLPTGALALAILLASSCGSHDVGGELESPLTGNLALRRTSCMLGVDADGDGVTDYYSTAQSALITTTSHDACLAIGGTPMQKPRHRIRRHRLAQQQSQVAAPPNNYREGGALPDGLAQDVEDAGIHNNTWETGVYDCDDFADDLEDALEDIGYTGTYTEICLPGHPPSWHAITDVHIDGITYWVDAVTGVQMVLDANGDGQVNTSTSGQPCDTATEGAWGVRVWNSLEERIAELGSPDFI